MTHQYKKLPVTMKMWMQFNVMPWTSLGVDAVIIHRNAVFVNDIFNVNADLFSEITSPLFLVR